MHNKCAAETHTILIETYGENAMLERTCIDWLRQFKNNVYECEDKKHSGALKKFEQ